MGIWLKVRCFLHVQIYLDIFNRNRSEKIETYKLNEKLGKIRYLYYPKIEPAGSVTQYLENCIKMLLDNESISDSCVTILHTSRTPNYYSIIGTVAYNHRVFYGVAYLSGGFRYRLAGKKDPTNNNYNYDIIDDRYSISYENKVITTDVNGYYHITTDEGNIINVVPISQVDGADVAFEIIRGANNINYIRFKNPSTNEYYGGGKTCTARFYKLIFDAFG